ncbi:MAG: S8 family serine peptidase [Microcoleaceae cyanobacterium]
MNTLNLSPNSLTLDYSSQPLIGVIDTGFNEDNPDIDISRVQLGGDYVDGDHHPLLPTGTESEHGTQILNVIGATQNNGIGIDGVNDEAPLWISRAVGSGQWAASLVEFVEAAKASGQPNAVVNLSFDLTQVNPDGAITTRSELTSEEKAALDYARQHGVLIVAAAGNQAGEISALGSASQEFDNIITVGTANGSGRADYSSYGEGLTLLTHSDTGTSVAAARVTGILSQVWATNPQLSYHQVVELLKTTATDLNTLGWDAETGVGMLNPEAAMNLAVATIPVLYEVPTGLVAPQFDSQTSQNLGTERPLLFGFIEDAIEDAGNFIGDTVETAVDTVESATELVAETASDFVETAVNTVESTTEFVAETAVNIGEVAVDTVASTTEFVAGTVSDFVEIAVDVVDGAIDIADDFVDEFGGVVDGVTDAAGDIADVILDAAGDVTDGVFGFVGLDSLGASINHVFDRVGDGLNTAFDYTGDGLEIVAGLVGDTILGRLEREIQWIQEFPERIERFGEGFWDDFWNNEGGFWTNFGEWLGTNAVNAAEVAGIPDTAETIASQFKLNTRSLTNEEIEIARSVFGDSINYSLVRIDEWSISVPIARVIDGADRNRPYTTFHTINTWGGMSDATLIHELTHVWQYENEGAIYIPEAIAAQNSDAGYDYGGVTELQNQMNSGEGLMSFNREQQAHIVEDYYDIREDDSNDVNLPTYTHFVQEVSTLSIEELNADSNISLTVHSLGVSDESLDESLDESSEEVLEDFDTFNLEAEAVFVEDIANGFPETSNDIEQSQEQVSNRTETPEISEPEAESETVENSEELVGEEGRGSEAEAEPESVDNSTVDDSNNDSKNQPNSQPVEPEELPEEIAETRDDPSEDPEAALDRLEDGPVEDDSESQNQDEILDDLEETVDDGEDRSGNPTREERDGESDEETELEDAVGTPKGQDQTEVSNEPGAEPELDDDEVLDDSEDVPEGRSGDESAKESDLEDAEDSSEPASEPNPEPTPEPEVGDRSPEPIDQEPEDLPGEQVGPVRSEPSLGTPNLGTPNLGTEENDTLSGDEGEDTFMGLAGDDTISGLADNDWLGGNQGNDWVNGGESQDALYGGRDDDTLLGNGGDDVVYGDRGNDTLSGVDVEAANPGAGEVDTLTGGAGNDRFVLGDGVQVYYNGAAGEDYGLVTDFVLGEDVIQLRGAAADYELVTNPEGLPTGVGIFYQAAGESELIGIVQGESGLTLNSEAFSFVSFT